MTGSVSEYFRQIEERNEQYKKMQESRNMPQYPYEIRTWAQAAERVGELRRQVSDTTKSKGVRQPLFTELRSLEKFWGFESNDYNHLKNSA